MIKLHEIFPYTFNKKYSKPAAYFSMEFAIDQALKIYSGGLGFLAGSHMRSAYSLKQNMIGIGILWKQGYYDQERNQDGTMKASFIFKSYSFLTETGIQFPISINGSTIHVKAFLLRPTVFNTAPIFLLSTDIPENDYLAQTICHRLYDPNESTRIAQSILLGTGGAKLLDILGRKTEIYHMNEGHALPLCFYLLNKYNDLEEVRKRVVFTTHTPEKAGNEEHSLKALDQMGFFQHINDAIRLSFVDHDRVNYTLTALRIARRANAVSKLHLMVTQKMWFDYAGVCEIIAVTNSQNRAHWMDAEVERLYKNGDAKGMMARKKVMKRELFREVADQTGKLFDENVFTLVWCRRFAAYKRADLILRDFDRFLKLINNKKFPIQIIWAGKPYPEDYHAIHLFNEIYWKTKPFANCAMLTGYELDLSSKLKRGADGWLNNPRLYHEASGTSGMTAAMNAALNISIADGWVAEFAEDKRNCFVIPHAKVSLHEDERDAIESQSLLKLLEKEVLPTYYTQQKTWWSMVHESIKDVLHSFDSDRMGKEYYEKLYR